MSSLRHMDKSFRNIMATWGSLKRSQAVFIGWKDEAPSQSPGNSPTSCRAAHVRGYRGVTQMQQELVMETVTNSASSPRSRLILEGCSSAAPQHPCSVAGAAQGPIPPRQAALHWAAGIRGFQKHGSPSPTAAMDMQTI